MRIAVIGGAGGMGRVTTADAAASEGVERVLLIDRDEARAAELAAAHDNVEARPPGEGAAGLRDALEGADAVVNAASHRLNLAVMQACLEVGAHYTDLGGLYYVAIEQYELDAAFRAAGLSAAISMGAAPGITNMLAAAAVAELDTVETIEVLDAVVAGRPYDPGEPYVPAYAADTLIDEFTRPAPMFIDGREQLMEAAGGARTYHLPEGDVECVYTIHSEQATLPRSYADRGIRTVEWRLGLPPAHTLPLRALVAAGMASTDPVQVDGRDVRPRDVLVAVLARQGGAADDPGRARAPARARRRRSRRPPRRDRRRPPALAARRVGHRLGDVLHRRTALARGPAAGDGAGAAQRRRRAPR